MVMIYDRRMRSPTSYRLPVIVSILHPFNATDGKESFAFCEGVTFIGEAGKLRLLQAGFPKEAFAECEGCDFYWRSWEASPPTGGISQGGLRRMRRL
ncbi:MAG: hypothetical protein IJR26_01545 [Bacteroidales bacterium]|nr:hypothetical protein [Bacteroidales bacterium]